MTPAQQITLACLYEVSAPKMGNVHRGADFDDLTLNDFLTSAVVVGPILAESRATGVGPAVLAAVRATRQAVGTNTNLGTVLLLAPLAAVPDETPLHEGIGDVLDALTPDDSAAVYEAIRVAAPGGLGDAAEMDVKQTPPDDLVAAMRLAADRDLVARQYTNRFHEVLQVAHPWLHEALAAERNWPAAIVRTQLQLMADYPDSLIARKCGPTVAAESAARAAQVLEAAEEQFDQALADFDFWLRSDGHRRNPGTTADLIAAAVYVELRGLG